MRGCAGDGVLEDNVSANRPIACGAGRGRLKLTLHRRSSMVQLTKRVPVESNGNHLGGMLRRMFNDPVLDEQFFRPLFATGMAWIPPMEVAETNDAVTLSAELPGIDGKAIRITVENNTLTIAGEKEQGSTEGQATTGYFMTERYYGAFQRSFVLPRTVDVERVKAEFDQGVLTVTLPKLAQAMGKTIEVRSKKA